MIIADIVQDNKKNLWILMGDNKEGQLLIEALEFYVQQNKRKSNAKKMLKDLESKLGCF